MKLTKSAINQDIYALIADESPNLVIITDANQKIEWVNKAFLQTCGYTYDEVIGKKPKILQGPETDTKTLKRIEKGLKNKEIVNERILNYTKDNKPYWINLQIIPVLNKEGKAYKFISIANNITNQVETESLLQTSEEKLHAILDSTIDSHYLLDNELNILAFNKVAAEAIDNIWHKKLELGNNIMDYLPKHYQKQFTKLFKLALAEKVTSQVEVNLEYTPDFSIWYSLVFSPAYSSEGTLMGVTLNATNIEKRKLAEIKLIETNKKLAEIARIQSHELRRPLANIMSLSTILQSWKVETNSKELIEKMLKATYELDEVVHRIVNSSQQEDIISSN